MQKTLFYLFILCLCLTLTACGQKNVKSALEGPGPVDQSDVNKKVADSKSAGVADVCNYFPKELIEGAIGKPIVMVESPFSDNKTCFYYTMYSETYDHTPYGDKPGGTPVVVVYDDKDFAKDKAYNETHGTIFSKDDSIDMDNWVATNNVKEIWQVALVLGDEKYLRIKSVHDAVAGQDLVKIAQKFAESIASR